MKITPNMIAAVENMIAKAEKDSPGHHDGAASAPSVDGVVGT